MMMVLISGGGSKCPPDFIFFYDLAMMASCPQIKKKAYSILWNKDRKEPRKKGQTYHKIFDISPKKLCSKSD